MQIGIIGAGKMGGGLGRLWAAKGHQVLFGSREPEKARAQTASLDNARGGSLEEAAAFGEIILLSVPWSAAIRVLNVST